MVIKWLQYMTDVIEYFCNIRQNPPQKFVDYHLAYVEMLMPVVSAAVVLCQLSAQ